MPSQYCHSDRERELRVLRSRLLRVRDALGLIRSDHWHRKYNPDQPRAPAGSPDGGQWTSGGGGGGISAGIPELPGFAIAEGEAGWSWLDEGWSEDGSIFEQMVTDGEGTTIRSEYAASRAAGFDERQTVTFPSGEKTSFETTDKVQSIYYGGRQGDLVARTIWTPSGPEPDATVRPTLVRQRIRSNTESGGAVLFGWMSPRNGDDGQQAVMGFNARDYRPGDSASSKLELSYSGRVNNEDAELACLRLREVRELTERAANAAGSPDLYPSRAAYGTAVHAHFKHYMDERYEPYFKAEQSFLKEVSEGAGEASVRYGYPGSIRVDAYEYRQDGTLCVYDLKTGKTALSDRRAELLANAAKLGFGPVRRVLVMEVRPRNDDQEADQEASGRCRVTP